MLRLQRRLFRHAVREASSLRRRQYAPVPRIIFIIDRRIALCKQPRLCRAVFLHGIVVIQMVLRQIGKHTHREVQAVHPLQCQRMRGNLHHHMGAALVCHRAQQPLHLPGVRRGTGRFFRALPHHVLYGAHQAHLRMQHRFKNLLDQIGGGGFSVCAGNAHKRHARCRIAEVVFRHQRQGTAHGADKHIGHILLRHFPANHAAGAAGHRPGNIPPSVCLRTGDGNKHISRLYLL